MRSANLSDHVVYEYACVFVAYPELWDYKSRKVVILGSEAALTASL